MNLTTLLSRTGTSWQHDVLTAATMMEQPLATARRVSVMSMFPTPGPTTTGHLTWTLGAAIGSHRPGRVLVVDTAINPGDPGITTALPPVTLNDLPAGINAPKKLLRRLRYATGTLGCAVDELPGDPDMTRSSLAALWQERVAPISRYFDIVLTHWPQVGSLFTAHHQATTGHAVVVVSPPTRWQAEQSIALARSLHTTGVDVTVAFVDPTTTQSHWIRHITPTLNIPVMEYTTRHRDRDALILGAFAVTGNTP